MFLFNNLISQEVTRHMRTLELAGKNKHLSGVAAHLRGRHLVVSHVARGGAEFSVGFDDLVHSLQKVFLCSDLSTSSDGKHSCLCTHTANLST